MEHKRIAIVGMGAILPDAANVETFWKNIQEKKYSITEVPADRWNASYYFDPDPKAEDKTYSKIGAFVQGYQFDAFKAGLAIPPRVMGLMDQAQQWAIAACKQALDHYGYPSRSLNPERVAVILGNALAGENHYRSTMRIVAPEYIAALQAQPEFRNLPESVRNTIIQGMRAEVRKHTPEITEDTMPGELSNIIAGRVANVFNFSGPNFVTDAACASSLAAMETAIEGLMSHKFDAALTGGVDRNMGPESFVKFSKIGALSADGSRPYADGANGFVMGEGAAIFLLKRLEDAERDGDTIYAVIRGVAGSSDGKGKGITAPNPAGQQKALERAWKDAGLTIQPGTLIEGHGTSTKVGDVAEVNSLQAVFGNLDLPLGSIALGSVKSNIGHLKSAAGAAGMLKVVLGLHNKVLPPSLNFAQPNPNIPFDSMPFRVNTETRSWDVKPGIVRRAGVSSFGFGGTNFHVVVEEYLPGMTEGEKTLFPISHNVTEIPSASPVDQQSIIQAQATPIVSNSTVPVAEINQYVLQVVSEKTGYPTEMLDMELDLEADLGVDTVKQAELFATIRNHYGIPRKEDLRLSDYNTLNKVVQFVAAGLGNKAASTPVFTPEVAVAENKQIAVITPADQLRPYQGLYFVSADSVSALQSMVETDLTLVQTGKIIASVCPSPEQVQKSERLAIDYLDQAELQKKMEKAINAIHANNPGMWAALQAQGIFRGSGSAGKVAFLFPGQGSQYVNMLKDLRDAEPVVVDTFREADEVMTPILGKALTSYIYVDGDEASIAQAEKNLKDTTITQPAMLTANVALLRVIQKYGFQPDVVIGHSLGEYAALVAAGALKFADALKIVSARGREMAKVSMADNGCMAAISAPLAQVEDVLKTVPGYVVLANINSPYQSVIGGETAAVDAAIQAFLAAGLQAAKIPVSHAFHTKIVAPASEPMMQVIQQMDVTPPSIPVIANVTGDLYPQTKAEIVSILGEQVASPVQFVKSMQKLYEMGTRVFIEIGPKRVLNALATDNLKEKSDVVILASNHPRKGGKASLNEALCGLYAAGVVPTYTSVETKNKVELPEAVDPQPVRQPVSDGKLHLTGSVVVTGAALGLPGRNRAVFAEDNITSLLAGDMRIESLDEDARQGMLDKKVTRLVKSEAGAVMEEITDLDQVLHLAGQRGSFDLIEDFGVPQERVDSLDMSTQLAIAAGVDALKDAGIPLVMNFRKTSKGTYLPDRWKLPESLQAETGVVFCSAFPGLNRMAEESDRFAQHQVLTKQLEELKSIRSLFLQLNPSGQTQLDNEFDRRELELNQKLQELDYHFDRRYVFRILSMGHSQFAEYIGAKGPNTHVNAACATTTHGIAIAEDWIRSGRCRRVIVIAGDDVTNPNLVSWIGTSLFASGAATTQADLRMAAMPFDRRRNGMIMGMGAAALVIESEDAARERGIRPVCEILSTQIANSAFHGTRLDVNHVSEVMDQLVRVAEERFNLDRNQFAAKTVFVSHETYTPARGGSASAEIHALRKTFKDMADRVVIANTKGFTGHAMGVGIEDVMAVKALQFGQVPPIAHIADGFEPDPELGNLNLSHGGKYPVEYALRLGAGFGSQIAMTLYRKANGTEERINSNRYQNWLDAVSGYAGAQLEIVQHTLRIMNQGTPSHAPVQSTWTYGTLPTQWMDAPETSQTVRPEMKAPVNQVAMAEPESVTSISTSQLNGSDAAIQAFVLQVVSEKTGYPQEMLDMDLDLEADLGIDTVKQAELFATIRTHYGIPRKEDLRLTDYNTLSKVVGFVEQNLSGDQPKSAPPTQPAASQPTVAEELPAVTDGVTGSAEITAYVLSVVAEKTGYPTEMLDLELDLEADLGIDTVKQAELFAAIRTHYGIPRREDLRLSDYNTLTKVIRFVEEGLVALGGGSQVETVGQSIVVESSTAVEQPGKQIQILRRAPAAHIRPKLEFCQPTGIKLDESTRVLVVAADAKLQDALVKSLKKHNVQGTGCGYAEAERTITSEAFDGVYFVASVQPKSKPEAAFDLNQTETTSAAIFKCLHTMPDLKFFVSATFMGGLGGINGEAVNPEHGILSGFSKALARERGNMFVKTVDFQPGVSSKLVAERLIQETELDPSNVEVGWENDLRYTFQMIDLPENAECKPIQSGSTFLVTGGTAGIIAPVVLDLARETKGNFILVGRNDLQPEVTQLVKQDRPVLQQTVRQMLEAEGSKATPAAIEQRIDRINRAALTLQLMDEVRALGGQASYVRCDITSPESVQQLCETLRNNAQLVDIVLHAAGMEKSRKIESKSLDEFQATIAAKVNGIQNLTAGLSTAGIHPSRFVLFSSVAGRFGNSGQTDYSAANDALSKLAWSKRRTNPDQQWISIDWGAWDEVGMASRGNIPHLMELAGIEMMPARQAAQYVRTELLAGTQGEVVISGLLGSMESGSAIESGIQLEQADDALRAGSPIHTMLSHLTRFSPAGEVHLEVVLDPVKQPFLRDHQLNGVPVLPGVIGIEGFSVAAKHIASVLAASSGSFEVAELEDIHFHAPFKFYRNQPRHVCWTARGIREEGGLVIYVTLESDLELKSRAPEHVLHFSGKVHLTTTKVKSLALQQPPQWLDKESICAEDIYKLYFHGPSFQVLDCAQRSGEQVLGKLTANLLPITDGGKGGKNIPLLVELCFQTAGLYEAGANGIMGLPQSIESLTVYRDANGKGDLYAVVSPSEEDGKLSFNARVVDDQGNTYLELKNYRTAALPYSVEPELVAPLKVLLN